jgi:hypothetical protein
LGGKNADKIYFGKPIIYDDTSPNDIPDPYPHYMYPNEARLRNMTYGMTINYDVEIEFIDILEDGEMPKAVAPLGVRLSTEDSDSDGEYENFKAKEVGPSRLNASEHDDDGQGEGENEQTRKGGAKAPVKKPFKKPKVKKDAITTKETSPIETRE